MPTSLPRSAPADQGVDPAAVLRFLDALDERPDIELHSLMLVRHGRVVAEGWWAPYSADRPQLLLKFAPQIGVLEVGDPFGGPPIGYESALDLIEQGCKGLLDALRPLAEKAS